MHAKPDLRVLLEWMIARSGSVITAVIMLNRDQTSLNQADQQGRRYAMATVAVAIGIGLAALYTGLLKDADHKARNIPWDWCILFFTGAYNSGLLAYYLMGDKHEYHELRRDSAWHTTVLNLVGAVTVGWDFQQFAALNKLSPGRILLLAWGLLLLIISSYHFYRALSNWIDRKL